MDGRLHQRAIGHGAGDGPRFFAILTALDHHLDAMRGPFAVIGNHRRQVVAGQ